MNPRHLRTPLLLALAALSMTAQAADATLFERIGGESVMVQVVDDMVATMAEAPTLKEPLEGVNLARFSHKLYLHMCATTGGPCVYGGDDMRTVHQGMNLTRAQLEVSSAALKAALVAHGVGAREIDELTKIRAPMKQEILEH